MRPFDQLALALLERREARALVAAWPLVKSCRGRAGMARWARAAAIPDTLAAQLAPGLLAAGLCQPGGLVPEQARAFVLGAAAAAVSGKKRRR